MPTLPAGAAQPRGCLGCKEKLGMQQVKAELPLPAQHSWAHRGRSKSRAYPHSSPHTHQTHSTSTAHYSTAMSAASTAKPKHTAQQPAPNRHPKHSPTVRAHQSTALQLGVIAGCMAAPHRSTSEQPKTLSSTDPYPKVPEGNEKTYCLYRPHRQLQ